MCIYIHVLCHLSQEWTKLGKPEGAPWPVERSAHAACCLNYREEQPQLLVTGGVDKNGKTLQDAWILDVKSGKWRKVSSNESHHECMVQLLESAARLYFDSLC